MTETLMTMEKNIPPIMTVPRDLPANARTEALTRETGFAEKTKEIFAKLSAEAAKSDGPKTDVVNRDDPKGILGDLKKQVVPTEVKPDHATPAKVEKPVEKVAEAPKEEYPDNAKSPEAKASWDKIKSEKAAIAAEKERLANELLELKKVYDPDAYKAAIQEKETLSQELRRLNVEKHPKFVEAFEKPLADAVDRAKKSVPDAYRAQVDKWLRQPDSPERDQAIQEITDALPVHKQVAFSRYVEDASLAVENKTKALSQEAEWRTQTEAQEKAATEKARIQSEAAAKATFKSVLSSKFSDNPLFTGEGSEDRVSAAENLLFGNHSPERLAEVALHAVYGENVAPLLQQAHDEIKRLSEQVDKLTSKSMGKSSSPGQSNDGMSFVQKVMAKVQGA